MSRIWQVLAATGLLMAISPACAEDTRQLVKMPDTMQAHMLANMRDHLASLNTILSHLTANEWQQAAEIAEQQLGMSSLDSHGAAHMAGYMPKAMQDIGTAMHRAASRFSRKVQESELIPALKGLQEITAACVACHAAYRIH